MPVSNANLWGSWSDMPAAEILEQPCERARAVPEATFTPTAVGLRSKMGTESVVPANMQSIIAEAIRQSRAAGMQ